jgi:hypothetical protein
MHFVHRVTPCRGWLSACLVVAAGGCKPTAIEEQNFSKNACYRTPKVLDGGTTLQHSFYDNTVLPSDTSCKTRPAAGGGGKMTTGSEGAAAGSSSVAAPSGEGAGGAGASGAGETMPPSPEAGDGSVTAMTPSDDAGAGVHAPASMAAPLPLGCTEQRVRAAFAQKITEGGCQDPELGGCHGGVQDPDPTTPNLLADDLRGELLGGYENAGDIHKCGPDKPRWITPGADHTQSLLWIKITSSPEHLPVCGEAMPPRDVGKPMPDADLACLTAWIDLLAAGK